MENLVIGKKLEQGTFGKVYKGKLNGKKVAIKIIKKDFLKKHRIDPNVEINILKKLKNKYVIRLLETFEDYFDVYHILEYVESDLYKIIRRKDLNETDALDYVKNITKGLIYLNFNNIAHFDIKPENILVDLNNNTKIADFGHAVIFEDGDFFENLVGTIYYIAPEVIERDYDYRADIWSLGISYYEMINKFPPFYMEDEDKVCKCILEKDVTFSYIFTENTRNNILKMLNRNPKERATFLDILKFEP